MRDGTTIIVGVAARDYRGLAASISGAFWHRQIDLRQAHLFSAAQHGLALDSFHLVPRSHGADENRRPRQTVRLMNLERDLQTELHKLDRLSQRASIFLSYAQQNRM